MNEEELKEAYELIDTPVTEDNVDDPIGAVFPKATFPQSWTSAASGTIYFLNTKTGKLTKGVLKSFQPNW